MQQNQQLQLVRHAREDELDILVRKWKAAFEQLPPPYAGIDITKLDIYWNDRMRSRAGLCKPYQHVVELNPHLLTDPRDVEETFVHELCHMAVGLRWPYARAHGQKWAKLMMLMGFEPSRCHTLVPVKRHAQRRWEIKCACRVHQVTTVVFNRIRRGARYRCIDCRSLLSAS